VFGLFVVLGVLAVGCLAFAGKEVAKEIDRQIGTASTSDYDLTGPECSVDEALGPQARGTITNTSKEQQAFQVEVRFVAPDGSLVSADSDFTDPIDVGQSTNWEVTSLATDAPEGTTCTLAEVSYTIFDNQNGN
jgi:hypothetical protein